MFFDKCSFTMDIDKLQLFHTADITGLSGIMTVSERDQCVGDDVSCDQNSVQDDSDYTDDPSDVNLRVIDEYREIVKHFNELPKYLFVAQLVRD